jgi:branched-chain amino acid transport system ATP-binding protein
MMQAQLAQAPTVSAAPLLAVRDVSVVFGGIIALNGVSFDMQKGHILGLIGPNGCHGCAGARLTSTAVSMTF